MIRSEKSVLAEDILDASLYEAVHMAYSSRARAPKGFADRVLREAEAMIAAEQMVNRWSARRRLLVAASLAVVAGLVFAAVGVSLVGGNAAAEEEILCDGDGGGGAEGVRSPIRAYQPPPTIYQLPSTVCQLPASAASSAPFTVDHAVCASGLSGEAALDSRCRFTAVSDGADYNTKPAKFFMMYMR